MYRKALEVGILPYEFWKMSLKEVKDTVNSRLRQKYDEIYALSALIRVAVLSVFSDKVQFPAPPDSQDSQQSWKNSYNYMKALQEAEGGAKHNDN